MRNFLLVLTFFYSLSFIAQVKVVSLSPIVTKTIVMLGAQEQVVGCTKWCPLADVKPVVGDAINVNIEEILKVDPDVIFVSTLTSAQSVKTLRDLNYNVIAIPRTSNFEVMCNNELLVGKEVGCLLQAQKEVQIAKQRLLEVQKKIDTTVKFDVMFQIGSKPIFVALPNTFVNDYIIQSGASNCYKDLEHGSVTRESVILRNPDAIFISIMPALSASEKLQWQSYPELAATLNNKIVAVNQIKASSPTIHDFVDIVEIMVNTLYAE